MRLDLARAVCVDRVRRTLPRSLDRLKSSPSRAAICGKELLLQSRTREAAVGYTTRGHGRGAGVGRGLGVGEHLPLHGVGVGVGVAVPVGVGVAVGVDVGVVVGVGVGVAPDCTSNEPLSMRPFLTRMKFGPR
jgi:hypothetical protein